MLIRPVLALAFALSVATLSGCGMQAPAAPTLDVPDPAAAVPDVNVDVPNPELPQADVPSVQAPSVQAPAVTAPGLN